MLFTPSPDDATGIAADTYLPRIPDGVSIESQMTATGVLQLQQLVVVNGNQALDTELGMTRELTLSTYKQ